MGVFSGWQSAVQSVAQTIAQLIGQDIVARSITLTTTASAGGDISSTGGRVLSRNASGGFSFGTAANQFFGMTAGSNTISLGSGANANLVAQNGSVINLQDTSQIALGNTPHLFLSNTAPTVAAGAGASVTNNNGSGAFTINLGGAASTGTITLPSATTGWVVYLANVTHPDANVLGQTGFTQTTATFTNYVRTTGVAGNWTANDVAVCIAFAF